MTPGRIARVASFAALGGAVLVLAACDRAAPPADPAPHPPVQATRAVPDTAPSAAPALAAASALAPPPMTLVGAVSFGPEDRKSEALLAVGAAPAQAFHPGDAIAGGWSLRSVASDYVVIAQGAATRRIDLASASHAATLPVAASPPVAAQDKPLPGFVQSAPARMSATDGQASARNRAFLQGVEQRRAARPPPAPP